MQTLDRRGLILSGAAALIAGGARADPLNLVLCGCYRQGGFALGRAPPRANLFIDGVNVGQASREGLFAIGFDRDCAPQAKLSVTTPSGQADQLLTIAPGQYDIQRIDGLPSDLVSPTVDPHPARAHRGRDPAQDDRFLQRRRYR